MDSLPLTREEMVTYISYMDNNLKNIFEIMNQNSKQVNESFISAIDSINVTVAKRDDLLIKAINNLANEQRIANNITKSNVVLSDNSDAFALKNIFSNSLDENKTNMWLSDFKDMCDIVGRKNKKNWIDIFNIIWEKINAKYNIQYLCFDKNPMVSVVPRSDFLRKVASDYLMELHNDVLRNNKSWHIPRSLDTCHGNDVVENLYKKYAKNNNISLQAARLRMSKKLKRWVGPEFDYLKKQYETKNGFKKVSFAYFVVNDSVMLKQLEKISEEKENG
jgi:hypothetical protein